jgi:hypothetical protein
MRFTRKRISYIFRIFPSLKSFVFWHLTPCSPVKANGCFGGTCRLHLQGRARNQACFMLVSRLAYSSTLKMEAICSSETSVDVHRNARRYIPEDRALHNHRCNNLKSSISFFDFPSDKVLLLLLLLLLPFKRVTK